MAAELPTIRKFNSLKSLGAFKKYQKSVETPDLKEANLIYGFNGAGKTTLSRVFASLEAGALRPELPRGAQFEIELSDGSIIKHDSNLNAVKGRVLVFNTDFIDANFRWKDGKANPIFYLGLEQTKLSQRLESLQQSLTTITPKIEEATRSLSVADRAFTAYKRDAARQIGEQINQARNYDASSIAFDYSKETSSDQHALDESERKQLRQLINADAPLPKLMPLEIAINDLYSLALQVPKLLGTTLGELTIQELSGNESMLTWIKEGINYHEANELEWCLLCGGPLQKERISKIRRALDEKFNKLQDDIEKNAEVAQTLQSQLITLKSKIPSKEAITQTHRQKFISDEAAVQSAISEGLTYIDSILKCLTDKQKRPNSLIGIGDIPNAADTMLWNVSLEDAVSKLNSSIELHNKSNETFVQSQNEAKETLKNHFLNEGREQYQDYENAARIAKVGLKKLRDQADDLEKQIAELRQALRKHGPAAAKINSLIACYLGHGALQIDALKQGEEGYAITREGMPLGGPLSEGEKTAIAVCYFLSTIEAEGRRLKDLIIVVDDPISSLDTRALNYAFNLMKGALGGAAQLIILTHNIHFMNETKKWLKGRAKKGNAALLFLDSTTDTNSGRRETNIIELPKLIREYESEYHYLFSIILGFKDSPQQYEGYFYLMPNALRKVLDIFFAFKVPGSSGLSSKLENPLVRDCGIEQDRIRALDRLAQLESHADSLDDLVSLSSITLEETQEAASALLVLIEALDSGHYKQMRTLCS